MRKFARATITLLAGLGFAISLPAADDDRNFSGKWALDSAASSVRLLGRVETSLTVGQDEAGMLCTAGSARWSYAFDGSETRVRIGGESRNSMVKWEGAALLVNTLVSGPENVTVMDRWALSRDRTTLTISRQIVRATGQVEGSLLYRREGAPLTSSRAPAPEQEAGPAAQPSPPQAPQPAHDVPPHEQPGREASQPALARKPDPGAPPDITVPAQTRVLLALVNEVSTRHAKDGDRVYLRTDAPVSADGRVVIPRGSDVAGTITHTKPAGKVRGKGELYIRFDSLVLPNGVSRDFRARPSGEEGKVEGNGKSADAGTVLAGAGMGATIGAITRGLGGAAVGGGIGALAGVLLSRNEDVVLRPGTHLEMVLDRDLVFHPDELRPAR